MTTLAIEAASALAHRRPPSTRTEANTDDGPSPAQTAARWAQAVGRTAAQAGVGTVRIARRALGLIDPDARAHIAQLPIVGLSLLLPAGGDVAPIAEDGHRPVVLVHGLGGHPGNFALVRARLHYAGRRRVYAVDLRGLPSADAMAQRVSEFVAAVCAINDLSSDARVDLIGHSLGGLASRMALRDPATAHRVATLVTVGTPHHGTWAARFAGTPLAMSLRPESELFAETWVPPAHTSVVTLLGESDVMITPTDHAVLPGARVVRLPTLTHFSILMAPSALDAIADAIA